MTPNYIKEIKMLRDAFEVSYTISGLDRTVLFAISPLFKPGTLPSDNKITGYGMFKLDSRGGNQLLLGVNATNTESNLMAAADAFERQHGGYRGADNVVVTNIVPVKVKWPTGEVVAQ